MNLRLPLLFIALQTMHGSFINGQPGSTPGVTPVAGGRAPAQVRDTSDTRNILLADPTIFYNKGTYYLYGTGGSQNVGGFPVYKSTDLKTWTGPEGATQGYALKKGDAYGDAQFWAPQVLSYRDSFYLIYAANEHIGVASSNSPIGPFKQSKLTPLNADIKQIDPYVFIDDDGKTYLYYVVVANGGNRIFVAQMNGDLLSVKRETEKLCIEATEHWENTAGDKWSVTEGPTVIKHKNLYYLIYSANDFRSLDYAVGYAVSTSPFGPWKKFEGNPIIHRSVTMQNGSGHGDLFKANNKWRYVFHTHNSAGTVSPRKTALLNMIFLKDSKTGIDRFSVEPASFEYLYHN